ncbi:MAG TPA: hypothetical protein VIH89_06165 [Candidatus Sulfotelmatobacter sp.]
MDPITAKTFLISRVIEEAATEQVNLSDVEKKMLHFTEVHPSLPDIHEVNTAFERDYNSDQYETKIRRLLKNARKRDSHLSSDKKQMWDDALNALKSEDHYILVMVYRAFPEYHNLLMPTHRVRDYLLYTAIGIALVFLLIGFAMWRK